MFYNLFLSQSLFRYIYYFENENPVIAVRFLSGLIALINEQLGPDAAVSPSASGRSAASVQSHYRNTLGMYMLVIYVVPLRYLNTLLYAI